MCLWLWWLFCCHSRIARSSVTHTHTHTHLHTQHIHTHMYTHTHTHTHIHTHTHTHTHTHIHTHTLTLQKALASNRNLTGLGLRGNSIGKGTTKVKRICIYTHTYIYIIYTHTYIYIISLYAYIIITHYTSSSHTSSFRFVSLSLFSLFLLSCRSSFSLFY